MRGDQLLDSPMTLGQRIRRLRRHHHLDQCQLANLLGCTDEAVSQWENDRRIPRDRYIGLMARLFLVSQHRLRHGCEDPVLTGIVGMVDAA